MTPAARAKSSGLISSLNDRCRRGSLYIYMAMVVHWAEHLVQAVPDLGSRLGAAGGTCRAADAFPWLVSSAWLDYGYAILQLVVPRVDLRPSNNSVVFTRC